MLCQLSGWKNWDQNRHLKDGAAFNILMTERARLKALLPEGWEKDFTTFFGPQIVLCLGVSLKIPDCELPERLMSVILDGSESCCRCYHGDKTQFAAGTSHERLLTFNSFFSLSYISAGYLIISF